MELEVFSETLEAPKEAPWGARLGPLELIGVPTPYRTGRMPSYIQCFGLIGDAFELMH